MDSDHYSITKKYSYIPGLQESSEDTFTVVSEASKIKVIFKSFGKEKILEEKVFSEISFERAKNVVKFLLENSVREGVWITAFEDCCR